MDFSEIYTQYIDDIRSNIQEYNNTEIKPYVRTHMPHQSNEDPVLEGPVVKTEDPDYVPFAMKLFQRRIKKFSSYRDNQEYIKRQNSVMHLQQVEKVQKEEE